VSAEILSFPGRASDQEHLMSAWQQVLAARDLVEVEPSMANILACAKAFWEFEAKFTSGGAA
jgi:hypothetical protein